MIATCIDKPEEITIKDIKGAIKLLEEEALRLRRTCTYIMTSD